MSNEIDQRYAAYGALLLRVSLGAMFLAHSLYLKVFVFTMPGTVGFFESLGLPGILAWATVVVEALGGIALILGVQVRLISLPLIGVLLGAAWVHLPNGWLFSAAGGGWEYPVFLALAQAALALIGPGAYALRLESRAPAKVAA